MLRRRYAFWRRTRSSETGPTPRPEKPDDPYGTLTRDLDQAPGGYPQVATFKSSDRNFLQFRGFIYLHVRLLLLLQQDIELLEQRLDKLDQFDGSKDGDNHKLKCKPHDDSQATPDRISSAMFHAEFLKTRPQVVSELGVKLLEYGSSHTLLLKTKEVLTLQKPSSTDYKNVRGWLMHGQPLVDLELKYIRRKEDIITLRTGRESAAFDCFVERAVYGVDNFLQSRLGCHIVKQNIFLTPELRAKTAQECFHYYAPGRLDALTNSIITFIIFTLMVLPVVSLFQVSNNGAATPYQAIGVLIVFTLLFGCAMSSLTKATRHELFAASAAYCAVLVVFIGNFGPNFQGSHGSVDG
ncbi:hypothetical protein PRZ48_002109 [Zasmidium cellare]|uniref:DUF6594 domain-containing protein n=1 Tax=Zasmidium cellare TaxID=395010 RepID=A0ABR0F510_ZASCE|nr:hypothetical protein PRZ48_002109 [Zasmidium cellare]